MKKSVIDTLLDLRWKHPAPNPRQLPVCNTVKPWQWGWDKKVALSASRRQCRQNLGSSPSWWAPRSKDTAGRAPCKGSRAARATPPCRTARRSSVRHFPRGPCERYIVIMTCYIMKVNSTIDIVIWALGIIIVSCMLIRLLKSIVKRRHGLRKKGGWEQE